MERCSASGRSRSRRCWHRCGATTPSAPAGSPVSASAAAALRRQFLCRPGQHPGGPGRTLVDAAVHYGYQRWRAALNLTDVADKTFVSSCDGSMRPHSCFYGERRKALLSLGLPVVAVRFSLLLPLRPPKPLGEGGRSGGQGSGAGVFLRTRLSANLLRRPPPPTPPHHAAKSRVGGGEPTPSPPSSAVPSRSAPVLTTVVPCTNLP